jgi:ElaB/YqjD/DUF883 family membrane-anchored ribosome-binding protein
MASANQTFRQAANSSAGREARDAVKSATDTAKSIGEDVSEFASDAARSLGDKAGDLASDVSRRAGRDFDRARGAAGDVWDEVHDATVRNPHLSLAIALGIGFLFGAFLVSRR